MRLPALPEATSCFRFDGTSGYVSTSNGIGFSKGASYSISLWFKKYGLTTSGGRFFSNGGSSGTPYFALSVDVSATNKRVISARLVNDSAATILSNSSTRSYQDGKWTHILWTDEAGSAKLYIDGVLDATDFTYIQGAGTYTMDRTAIGTLLRNTASNFQGCFLYDTRVYNRVLSATEAQDLADGKEIDSTSLALRWIGNQNGGATVPDASGNGNSGTFTTPSFIKDSPFYPVRSRVGGNLIYNGDFQIRPLSDNVATTTTIRWIDGTAAGSNSVFPSAIGWSVKGLNGFAALMDTTTKYSGAASLKLSTTAVASYAEARDYSASDSLPFYRAHLSPVRPSTSYTLTFMMKTTVNSGTSNSTGGGVQLVDINSAGSSTRYTTVGGVNTTTGWTRYSQVITTSSDTQFLSVRPLCYGHQGSANLIMDAWFDEITLTETTPVTRSTATGRLAVRDFGTALSFDGSTSQYVSISQTAVDTSLPHTFSAVMRVNAYLGIADRGIIDAYASTTDVNAYGSRLELKTSKQISFRIGHGAVYVSREVTSTNPVPKGVFFRVTGVFDGTNLVLYINTLSTTANAGGSSDLTSAFLQIGKSHHSNGGTPCTIAEAHIWQRALSATEVSELYYNGLTRGSALATGLVGEWLFNEGSGSTAYDTSGNGNHGTITGATYSTDVPCVNRSAV